MGKRSNFKRRPQDTYDTPEAAVLPLLPHLPKGQVIYYEPCVGSGDLWSHISRNVLAFAAGSDIAPRLPKGHPLCVEKDALALDEHDLGDAEFIITNPPWTRAILHPMIEHFSDMRPTWLLFDADWMHTKQSAPYLDRLRKVVSVGRVKWIKDSPHTGKDNCAWHLFDKPSSEPTEFVGRSNA